MSNIELHRGDNRESIQRLIDQGVRVHSVVTDPPYGLVSIAKRFGKGDAAAARTEGNDGSFSRLSGGFMGKSWDASGIERDPEFWALIYEILLPGGFVFAFSAARTGHWQACAMEQAGFIMYPFHGWVYGQGYPKALDAAKSIDKKLGHVGQAGDKGGYIPATPEAARWQGWKLGAGAHKPALEPIYLAQKPFATKTGAENLLDHGLGAVNIDGCRVPTDEQLGGGAYAKNPTERSQMWGEDARKSWVRGGAGEFAQPDGRYPANLFHDGSPEVVDLFPATGGGDKRGKCNGTRDGGFAQPGEPSGSGEPCGQTYADTGTAARFFNSFDYDEIPPLFYHGKAGKEDRAGSNHPTVKPIGLIRHLVRHITPPGGVVLDPFAGTGTTAAAALAEGFDCILMEADPAYCEFINDRFFALNVKESDCVKSESSLVNQYGDIDLLGDYGGTDKSPLHDLLGQPSAKTDSSADFEDLLG